MLRHHIHAALIIAVCACSDSGSVPGQGGTVRATIYGADSWGDVAGPLPGVTVTIAGRSEVTGELGIAYVTQLPSGVLEATVDRPGSELLETQVTVVAGDTVDLVEELLPVRPSTGRVEVYVALVSSPPGSPDINAEGAVVTLGTSILVAGASGLVDFPFVSAGGYRVRAEHEGAQPDSALIEVMGGDTVSVRFRLNPAP